MTHAQGDERLLRTQEVAEMFSVNPSTVARWAAQGRITPAVRTLGGEARYRRGDILRLIEDAMREPEPDLADELLHTRPAR